ncbi:MAG TPA: glycosyltransferase family 2 protein [Casimicrobiaceae bacterium]|nr:glycosyltransferase family 2 protein [Casimicrobiaceae bacterium]
MIDVIVPVFRGVAATRRCLESVLANAQRTAMCVVVVDDASPEAEISAYVDALAMNGRVELVRSERNLGFVRAVNLGMAKHPDRDVVLLNSDTEVANDWLDRLAACAARETNIGTVTPFSNQATICSYPFEGWTAGIPGGLGLAALDGLFASVNAARSEDLPTAVGFCMYIRRPCLDAVGLFDDERFGRGYGEENDFCLRAAEAGWRNVVAADVFVFHEGAVSFADERGTLIEAAGRLLVERHPDYPTKVSAFVAADPLRGFRSAVDEARRTHSPDEAAHVCDERVLECDLLRSRLAARSTDIDALVGETRLLREGLAHAESLVRERDAEIRRLTAAFAHAESLALDRGRQLARINESAFGKVARYLSREKP